MPLTQKEVAHIAELARLDLTDDEQARFRQHLSDVLAHAARLEELDTDAIPPTAAVLPQRSVMRDDEARPSFTSDDILANAPAVEDRCFRVPPVTMESEPES